MGLPKSVVVVTACCGQAIGCGHCIEKYLLENDNCPLCKAESFITKLIHLKGFLLEIATLLAFLFALI